MSKYTDIERKKDFDFFISNYDTFYQQYGHNFLAIKNQKLLGAYDSVQEAIDTLSVTNDMGTYIIQECICDESAYKATIMRLIING